MQATKPRLDRTIPEMAFLFKYVAALIAFFAATLFSTNLSAYPAQIPFLGAFVLAGVFCLTATEVRACEQVLEYRRFLVWKPVQYAEIRECKKSWLPWFGYMRLTRFVPPWGRIYFVIVRPLFAGNPKGLVSLINSRRAGMEAPTPDDGLLDGNGRAASPVFHVFLVLAGVFMSLMYAYLTPEFDQRIRAPSNSMGVVALYFRLLHDATSWPWAIATIAIIAAAIIKFRSSRLIWILPLALGTIVGNVLARALR
jgi:hypothetical protein